MSWAGYQATCGFPQKRLSPASWRVDRAGNARTGSNLAVRHIIGNSAAPAIAANAGAGTSPTVSVIGTDIAGQVSITTGTLPSVASAIVTLTFAAAFTANPYVVLWPAEANAAVLGFLPYVTSTTTTFVINSATALGLAPTTNYKYNYVCVA